MHKALFWVAVAVLQLDEVNLYSAGTALLEQNLHTLDTMRVFNDKVNTHYAIWKEQVHFFSHLVLEHTALRHMSTHVTMYFKSDFTLIPYVLYRLILTLPFESGPASSDNGCI